MRYHVLACDYDGTLATGGQLLDDTRAALERVRATGRRLILVTGRVLVDLQRVCPNLDPFEVVVAENGAVLYRPATRELRTLAEPPPPALAEAIAARGIPGVGYGQVIVASWEPHESALLDVVRELGLEMQVIFNKGAVMMLPSGVNKGSGLNAALEAIHISPHNVVGVGDAENDHALLAACECGVAVANALPMLRERADWVTAGANGAGVIELCDRLVADDLAELAPRLARHDLVIGTDLEGRPVTVPAYGTSVLLAGPSGGGKSTTATAFLERMEEQKRQYCLLDPEGDHGNLPGAVILGSEHAPPAAKDIEKLLDKPGDSAVVSLLGLALADRPAFFDGLLPRLEAQRAASGRPHWIVVDEAHHFAPDRNTGAAGATDGPDVGDAVNLMLITVHPAHVAKWLLKQVHAVVIMGIAPESTIQEVASVIHARPPELDGGPLARGEGLLWRLDREPGADGALTRFRIDPPRSERRRHIRKYAEGELPPDRSFYFKGAAGKLNLRAWNLMSFLEIGDGVDDDTWNHHLTAGDYSRWINRAIKDSELAAEIASVERKTVAAPADQSRRAVREAIEQRYTAPV